MTIVNKYALASALAAIVMASPALSDACSDDKTITPDVLTIATGNPAYSPWVYDDDPESGEGFEAALAWEIARRMGYDEDSTVWVRTSFDEAIQPGVKNFDFNLQQFSILPEREQVIDFSNPYYTAGIALVVRSDVAEKLGAITSDVVRSLKFGGASGQTSSAYITDVIEPTQDVLLYDDMSDVTAAMQANQIEATVFDVPTALFITAVRYTDGKIIGEFSNKKASTGSQFALIFSDGNPLRECANDVLAAMTQDGTLAEIETTWINNQAGIPLIDMSE